MTLFANSIRILFGEGKNRARRSSATANLGLEQLEDRDVPSEGLNIPTGHAQPRLWFTPERLADARQWYVVHPFTPAASSPIENAFVYQMTGNTTYAQRAVTALMNFTISSAELAGSNSNAYRWGSWVPVVYDWCYNQMTATQRSTFTTRYNGYTTTIMGKDWGGPGFVSNNYYWGYWRNALNWGIATYGDNPMAETYLHDTLATRWQDDFVPWAAEEGAGGVALEGIMYGREVLEYTTIALQTSILLGRDLLAETNFYTEAVYNLIYSTSPGPLAAPGGRSFYQVFPFNDDENSSGFPNADHTDYSNFMTVSAGEFSGTNLSEYARQWLSAVGGDPDPYVAAVDSGGPARPLSSLPPDYYAPGPQYLYTKTDWTPSAMSLGFQLGWVFDVAGTHGHSDAGSFQISRNGQWLTKESTGYVGNIVGYRGSGTAAVSSELAHNGLLFQGRGLVEAQFANGAPRVTRLESRPEYTFASVDLTPAFRTDNDPWAGAYDNPNTKSVVRDFVYVRGLDALIAFDRMESRTGTIAAANVEKTFLLHFPNNPTVSGNTVTGVNGSQALKLTSLTPAGQTPASFRIVNETPGSTLPTIDYQYRLESTTSGQAQSYLINVLQARSATGADLAISMTEDATGFTITLRDPATGETAVVNLNKGMTSSGGSVGYSPTGTPTSSTSLTSSVEEIHVTTNGVTWGAASPATTFQVSAPSIATAGAPITVTVTARDAFGNTASGYLGIVRFDSSDGQAVLPGNYTFTSTDAGIHTFTVTLKTAGSRSITTTDTLTGSITGNDSLLVTPATATTLQVSAPTSTTAGSPFIVSATAKDTYGNTATGYTGTVRFTSTDAQAALPPNYTFTAVDNGTHTFTVTMKTAGSRSITTTDTLTGSITGSDTVTVIAAAASTFTVAAPATATAGSSFTLTATAKDAYGNTATGYTGTVRFTSTDAQAVLPPNYTFTAVDNGIHTFSATLKTAGSRSVTATDTAASSVAGSATVTVNPAAATALLLSGYPSPTTAGAAQSFAVQARDSFGNTATGYTGIVRFTSTDAQAVLPLDYTFTVADNGAHTFSATLTSVGVQSITATDTATGSVNGSATITVVSPVGQSFAVGTGAGSVAAVSMYAADRTLLFTTTPFAPSYKGGVRVAVGDVTGDGVPDVVAGTSGGVPARVRVINGATGAVLADRLLGSTTYSGPVSVAVGDVTGDGVADIAVGTTENGPRARVFSGATFARLAGFHAGPATNYKGRTQVALGDVDNDGKADLLVSGLYPRGSWVVGYTGTSLRAGASPVRAFTAFVLGGGYARGLNLAVGDVNADGFADLVLGSGVGADPNVNVYSGKPLVESNTRTRVAAFPPAGASSGTGVRVGVRDMDGDGQLDVITSSGELVSAFQGGSGLPASGPPLLLFSLDPNPLAKGIVWVG